MEDEARAASDLRTEFWKSGSLAKALNYNKTISIAQVHRAALTTQCLVQSRHFSLSFSYEQGKGRRYLHLSNQNKGKKIFFPL